LGTYGFKAVPITGYTLAELIATGKTPVPLVDRSPHDRTPLLRLI